MKANEPLDLSKDPRAGCNKCGASTREMFYEMMEDDIDGHQCKPKKRITIGNIILPILFWLSIFGLIVSFIVLGAYIHTFI